MAQPESSKQQSSLPPIAPIPPMEGIDERGAETQEMTEMQAKDEQLKALQNQVNSMSALMAQLAKQTGVKQKATVGELIDAEATIPQTYIKEFIVEARMKPGSHVVADNFGNFRDMQIIEFTTADGKSQEMDYNSYRQMTSNNQLPVQIIGYLIRGDKGYYFPANKNLKPDDFVKIRCGRYGESGIPVYDGPEMETKVKFLNAK